MVRKQSPQDRAKRLADGVCPVHGRGGAQESESFYETDPVLRRERGTSFVLSGCDGQCPIRWQAYRRGNFLLPEWQRLLQGEQAGEMDAPFTTDLHTLGISTHSLDWLPVPCPHCGWYAVLLRTESAGEVDAPARAICAHCHQWSTLAATKA